MANITRSRANSNDLVSARSATTIQPDVPWTVVTAGKGTAGKGKKKPKQQQQLLSFKPTFARPAPASSESNAALSGQTAPSPVELVVPYLKGREQGSVFIDITHVKNLRLLREALDDFNKDADSTGNGYNEFLGRCEKTRFYLNHEYMETLWAPGTAAYHTIVNEGITLSDNTFIKGFPSYSADSSIVRVNLTGLPFLQLPILKKDLEKCLQRFGKVLDFGLSKKDGYYVGGGYATLELPPGKPCRGTSCIADHVHIEPLQREIIWDEEDEDIRKVLLTWDAMPDFCRICGSAAHCRADCPDLKSWLKCFNCHGTGHVWKKCPRNNDSKEDEAPSKTRAVPEIPNKKTRKTPLIVNNSTTSPIIVDTPSPVSPATPSPANPGGASDGGASNGGAPLLANDSPITQPQTVESTTSSTPDTASESAVDDAMPDVALHSTKHTKERSPSPQPEDDPKKIAKINGSGDVTVFRKKQGQGRGFATGTNAHYNRDDTMQEEAAHSDTPANGDQATSSNQQ